MALYRTRLKGSEESKVEGYDASYWRKAQNMEKDAFVGGYQYSRPSKRHYLENLETVFSFSPFIINQLCNTVTPSPSLRQNEQ